MALRAGMAAGGRVPIWTVGKRADIWAEERMTGGGPAVAGRAVFFPPAPAPSSKEPTLVPST